MRAFQLIHGILLSGLVLLAAGGKALALRSEALPEVPIPSPSQAVPATSIVSQERGERKKRGHDLSEVSCQKFCHRFELLR